MPVLKIGMSYFISYLNYSISFNEIYWKRLFAGLIRQIVSYLSDYFPANSALFAGLIRQILSYLPDYENFVGVHIVLYGTGVTNQKE